MKTGFIYDPVYLGHDTGNHVENAGRLEAIMSHLERTGVRQHLVPVKPRPATFQELSLVHTESHIQHVREVGDKGGGWLDMDTVMSPGSYDAALYAAGGSIEAACAVMGGQVDNAFALVRPPGHHATPDRAMGFCLFNNVAIAARYVMENLGAARVAIIDFDVHHGNGTQEAFYADPHLLYVSTHEFPHYPGTGRLEETGSGEGKGFTLNVPLPAGCGDGEYGQVFEQIIVPAVRRFQPRLIMASAGYDGHWHDPLAYMGLSVTGYARITAFIRNLAEELCGGKAVLCLEGGYDLTALAASVKATFDVMMGEANIDDPLGQSQRVSPRDIKPLISEIKRVHGLP